MNKRTNVTNSDPKYIPATAGEWDLFFKKNGPRIVRSLGRCGSPQDCEDAVQAAAATIMGLDPDHHLEAPLEPRTEDQWVGFVWMHARAYLSHKYEHDAKWAWAGSSHRELRDAEADALADRTLSKRAREERLRNIRRQIKCLVDQEGVRNMDSWSPVRALEEKLRRLAVREMVDIVCREYRVSDRDREVFIRTVLEKDDCVADDLLDGDRGHRDTIVCRVNAKLIRHGRAVFKRARALAEAKFWRLGA